MDTYLGMYHETKLIPTGEAKTLTGQSQFGLGYLYCKYTHIATEIVIRVITVDQVRIKGHTVCE